MADPSPVWDFLNQEITKSFVGSLVGALAGAGAGALSASWIATRIKTRDERIQEIKSVNAGVTMAYAITENYLNIKLQIVKPLVDLFEAERGRIIAAVTRPELRKEPIKFDLQTFNLIKTRVEDLSSLVFNRIAAPTRPAMVTPILTRTIQAIEVYMDDRNRLIDDFRHKYFDTGIGMDPVVYFGLPTDHGADMRYANLLSNISMYTDDAIYFSKMIGDDLRRYAGALKDTLPDRFKPQVPIIVSADFSRRADIMPNPEKYKDYENIYMPMRAFGRGIWTADFELLAHAQYETEKYLPIF